MNQLAALAPDLMRQNMEVLEISKDHRRVASTDRHDLNYQESQNWKATITLLLERAQQVV